MAEDLATKQWPSDYTMRPDLWPKATSPRPSMETLMEEEMDAVVETTDGCMVEPDGFCEHGHVSWLRVLGLI